MAGTDFFAAPTEASKKKQRIASNYFAGWSNIVLPQTMKREKKLMYVDFFCGPGRYRDGTPSTPLMIAEHVASTPRLAQVVHLVFTDRNQEHVESLRRELKTIRGIDSLKYSPSVKQQTINREIIPQVSKISVPTLFFADPWGYRGVSVDLIGASLSHWGSDFLFFFNYNRINMNLTSTLMTEPIDEFFSEAHASKLRAEVSGARPHKREQIVVRGMRRAIKDLGAKTEVFRYLNETGARSTHYLMLASKHSEGVSLFKEISARESSQFDHGVPSLSHDPSGKDSQLSLFSPIDCLETELVRDFAGRQNLSIAEIYHEHHVGKPYVLKNYRDAVTSLSNRGIVRLAPSTKIRRERALTSSVRVCFPRAS